MSVLGFAAGYGSFWRFPYLVYANGGGTFLIPYFVIFFTVGLPVFYFETAIGQVIFLFQNIKDVLIWNKQNLYNISLKI